MSRRGGQQMPAGGGRRRVRSSFSSFQRSSSRVAPLAPARCWWCFLKQVQPASPLWAARRTPPALRASLPLPSYRPNK